MAEPTSGIMVHKPENGQAGVAVTPAMIEAGERELFFYEPGESYAAECVAEIYAAMEAARLRGLRKT